MRRERMTTDSCGGKYPPRDHVDPLANTGAILRANGTKLRKVGNANASVRRATLRRCVQGNFRCRQRLDYPPPPQMAGCDILYGGTLIPPPLAGRVASGSEPGGGFLNCDATPPGSARSARSHPPLSGEG